MTKSARKDGQQALALNLPQLQNLVKRDPQSYIDEFRQQARHWDAQLGVFRLDPTSQKQEDSLSELIGFLAQTIGCFPKEQAAKDFPDQMMGLLQGSAQTLKPELRKAMVQALILLRNKDAVLITKTMPLFFSLFRIQDKDLRKLLHSHIVSDIKNANVKAKNNKLNKTLQNFMYTMLKDDHEMAARKSLEVMIELYTKNIWNDAKTVNVIAEACFSPHPKIASTALHFFLGTHDKKNEEVDEDEPDMDAIRHKIQINSKKKSKTSAVDKAMASIKRKQRAKERAEIFNFSALHLLHSPQDFTDKLFARLKQITANSSTFRYDIRLAFIDLISRLIGIHKLINLAFYTYLTPYLTAHQRQVPKLLAYCAQASHDLVPPDTMQPVVQQIADKFIWSNSSTEVVVAGLNSIREICQRCPLAMGEDLLGSLIDDYKNHRDKGSMMAVRALLSLYRDINPHILNKKHRGKGATMNLDKIDAPEYGRVNVMNMIDGADLFIDEQERIAAGGDPNDNPGDGWDEWEIDSDGMVSEEEEETKVAKRKANAKAIVEVLEGEDDGDMEEWADDDEEDGEGEEMEEGDEVDDEEEESDEEEEAVPEKKMGPKQKKLMEKEARKNLEKKLEADPAKKLKVMQALTETILTDEDFAKMREMAANRKAEVMAGMRRSRVTELMEEDEEENGEAQDRDVIDPRRIVSGVKRKSTYEERIASIEEGRKDRDKYGSRMGSKKAEHGGSTTNREKQKKTKNFQMITHKRSIQGKATRSLRDKQKVMRQHIVKQKKKGH
ncbi:Protein SDA1 [Podochytrium sp. JEL0797]|nr:Protein SDA1 [Podochytrium sp. JEL0797]